MPSDTHTQSHVHTRHNFVPLIFVVYFFQRDAGSNNWGLAKTGFVVCVLTIFRSFGVALKYRTGFSNMPNEKQNNNKLKPPKNQFGLQGTSGISNSAGVSEKKLQASCVPEDASVLSRSSQLNRKLGYFLDVAFLKYPLPDVYKFEQVDNFRVYNMLT